MKKILKCYINRMAEICHIKVITHNMYNPNHELFIYKKPFQGRALQNWKCIIIYFLYLLKFTTYWQVRVLKHLMIFCNQYNHLKSQHKSVLSQTNQ